MAMNPIQTAQEIYNFTQLSFDDKIRKWIEENTKSNDNKSTYTTSRNSSQTAFKWKSELPLNEIKKVQDMCSEEMVRFGYNLIKDQADLDNGTFQLINKKFDHMDAGS